MRVNRKNILLLGLKDCVILAIISIFVLIVNYSIISLDLMYAEQPLMYVANQTLHSLGDLIQIYLHPKMLHIFSIPFFRPSGHFLMYQLLTPLLGWHNTKAFIIVNLLFLAFTGYVTIKLYALLFPGYQIGGYLAFSLYLMHPALMLSRLIVLHFEFAYVFFTMLSLYCFVRFCKRFSDENKPFSLLALSVVFFMIAVTFKEPALMLGPVLACYFCIHVYSRKMQWTLHYHKERLQILCLLGVVTLASTLYLTLPWPSLSHPLGEIITAKEKLAAVIEFFKILLALPMHFIAQDWLYDSHILWRDLVFPWGTCLLLWGFYLSMMVTTVFLMVRQETMIFKKPLLFLLISALLFLLLPINWAMGLPWHLSLTLVCLSIMMGFSGEYLLCIMVKNHTIVILCGLTIAVLIGLSTLLVNKLNISKILSHEGYSFTLAGNAVRLPPDLKNKLDAQSVIVVEDSTLHNSYALGNSGYTFLSLGNFDYDDFQRTQDLSFLQYKPLYNGNLFKWAYLLPELQEEVYPFQIDHMQQVSTEILYNWLQHYNNIFCLGYDKQGNWHDRTADFKKNLAQEKLDRLLQVHQYEPRSAASLNGKVMYTKKLIFPDYQLCQYECDQNVQCRGFSYENGSFHHHSTIKCQFYDDIAHNNPRFCATCIGFIKH